MADRMKNKGLFRKKSLEKVSSPENLDQYMKATTPSLWLLLAAILLLLVGVLVWSIFGKLESSSVIGIKVEDGTMVSYIAENEYEKMKDSSYIQVQDLQFSISKVKGPVLESNESDAFLIQAAGIEEGAWYYILQCETELPDGTYKGTIIFEQISPITFIIN